MNVPQLRFSGFEGEWEKKLLSEICIINPKTSELEESFLYIDLESINKGELQKFAEVDKNNAPSRAQRVLQKKDVLFQTVRPYQQNHYLFEKNEPKQVVASTGFAQLRAKENPNFLYHLIYSNSVDTQVMMKCTGTSYPAINGEGMKTIRVNLPSKTEQEKIAKFFDLLSNRIKMQKEKVEKLEHFKKGMMQKVFSQELRFKDEDSGEFQEWRPTTFHEVADIRRGASPRPIADPKWFSATSKIGWLRISDVTASGVYLKEVTQYLSEEGIKKSVLLEEPHLILSIAATIGKPVINKIPLCIHDGFIVFKNLKLDMLFGYYYLEHFQDKWLQFRQPGSQFNLNSDLVGNLNIMIPSNKEQEAIAKFFSAIDTKIEKEKEKLMVLEEQKRGFMWGMFI